MTDISDSRRRSEMMDGIKGGNTAPEIAVRCIAHKLRFRPHRNGLPAAPTSSSRAAALRYSRTGASVIGTTNANLLNQGNDETDMPFPRSVSGSRSIWYIVKCCGVKISPSQEMIFLAQDN